MELAWFSFMRFFFGSVVVGMGLAHAYESFLGSVAVVGMELMRTRRRL
jgi:hypothetical protein